MLNDMAFCHLQEKLVINIVTKLMDTAIRAQIDAAKTASERVVQKSAEATGDLTGNEIADTTISVVKTKSKEKKYETRNLDTTRKTLANHWWYKIVLIPYKYVIPKNYKPVGYNIMYQDLLLKLHRSSWPVR